MISKHQLHEVLSSAGSSEHLSVDSHTLKNCEELPWWYTLAASSEESCEASGSCIEQKLNSILLKETGSPVNW